MNVCFLHPRCLQPSVMEHGEPAVPSGNEVAVSLALPWRLENGVSFAPNCQYTPDLTLSTNTWLRRGWHDCMGTNMKLKMEDERACNGHDETWKDTHKEGECQADQ